MEIDDREASRIHGIISSDSDSDYNSRELDEEYNALKPPPLDYNLIKDKIVVISRQQVVNVWEERLKNVEKNSEERIRAVHNVTLATKKKKKKLKVNAGIAACQISPVAFPELKKSIEKKKIQNKPAVSNKNPVNVKNETSKKSSKKKLKENEQNQVCKGLPSKSSCSSAVALKTKKQEAAKGNSPKVLYDFDTLKQVEEKINGLKNVWHSGLSNTIIQEELNLQRQRESSMYEFWIKKTIKEEDKAVKNKGKTTKKSKQPVEESSSTNLAKNVKDTKKDEQSNKNSKDNGTKKSNLTFLEKGTMEYAWQCFNSFSNDSIFTETIKANTTMKTKKKTRSKKKSKQLVNQNPMNESCHIEDISVKNMSKRLKDVANAKKDFEEFLEMSSDEETWNMRLFNKENTKKEIPKNKEKQIIKDTKENGTQNVNFTLLDQKMMKGVLHLGNFFSEIQQQSGKKLKNLMNESHNSEDSVNNMTTQLQDEAKAKTHFEEVLETSTKQKCNIQQLNKENIKKGITHNEEKQIIKDTIENDTQNANFTPLDQEIVKRVWYWQYFDGSSNDMESGPLFTNETMTETNATTKTKKKTRSKKKSKQSVDQSVNQSSANELHNNKDDSVENMTIQGEDEAKAKTDFEEVLEILPNEEKWNMQSLDKKNIKKEIPQNEEKQIIKDTKENGIQNMNLTLLDEELVKRIWYWQYFDGFSNDMESGPLFTNETMTETNTTTKTKKKTKSKEKSNQAVDKSVNQSPTNELHNNKDDSVENMTTQCEDEAKAKKDFEEVLETSPNEEKWNMQLLDKENIKKEIPQNEEKQIIEDTKENGIQNMNLTLLDEELVKRIWYWQYFDGFSNYMESGPLYTNETMTETNTTTKTKRKTKSKEKSNQAVDKSVNQSPTNELHNNKYDSVENMTTQCEDEAKAKTDFEEVLETSPNEEKWNMQLLDKENIKKEIPQNEEKQIIEDTKENGIQNMNLTLLDEELVKRVWYFSNDMESGPLFTNETKTETNTTTKTKKKTKSKKKSKQSMDQLANQSSTNKLHNSDDFVENMTKCLEDKAKAKTNFKENLKMLPDGEKCNRQLLDKEIIKNQIPKGEEKPIMKDSKENNTENSNLTLLDQETVKGVWHSNNFFKDVQQLNGFSNDIENNSIFTNKTTKINTLTKTKKKTRSKKKSKKSVDKLVPQSLISETNFVDNMAKQDKHKYADSKEALEASYGEETYNPQLHKVILAPAWFLSPDDTKIRSFAEIQGEIRNRSNIEDTKQADITSATVAKPKTKRKKKKSKQSTAVPLSYEVGQHHEKTNQDRVELEKQRREKSTDVLQHQQTAQESVDLNVAVQETASIENNPINRNLETFDNITTLKKPQYVFDEGFKDFIQDILCENGAAAVPELNDFNYEQLQRAYTSYQEKKNATKQHNTIAYNVATKKCLNKKKNNFWPSFGNLNTNPNSCSTSLLPNYTSGNCITYPDKGNINVTTKLLQERHAMEAKLEVPDKRSVIRSSNFSTKTANIQFFSKDKTKSSELRVQSNHFEEKRPVNYSATVLKVNSATSRSYDNTSKDLDERSFARNYNDALGFDAISTSNTNQYKNIYGVMYDGRSKNSSDDIKNTVNDRTIAEDGKGLLYHLSSSNDDVKSNPNVTSTYSTSYSVGGYRQHMKNTDYRESIVSDENTKEFSTFSWEKEVKAATSRDYDRTSKDFDESFRNFTRIFNDAVGFDMITSSNAHQYKNIYRVIYNSRSKNSSDDIKKTMTHNSIKEDSKGLLYHLGSSNDDIKANPNVTSTYSTLSSVTRYRHNMKNTDYRESIVSNQNTKKVPFSWENQNYVESYAEEQHLGENSDGYKFKDRNHSNVNFRNTTSYFNANDAYGYKDNEKDTLVFVLLHIVFIGITAVLVASLVTKVVSFLYDNIFFVGLIIFICMKFKSQ